MALRILLAHFLAAAILGVTLASSPAGACCPAPPYRPGDQKGVMPVVNADQSVIILWDAKNKTQHFIRRASFKSEADDFGFLIPSPTQPKLAESGNEAFPALYEITKPEVIIKKAPRGGGGGCSIGCGDSKSPSAREGVKVLEEIPDVAGFKAAVLEAKGAKALVDWLGKNGYAYSPEVEAWAKPYIEQGWIITAFQVAKGKEGKEKGKVNASALRMTFKTDRPLFPYREPDSSAAVKALGVSDRLLRIYFLADARYRGELTKDTPWTGKVAWSGNVGGEDRNKILGHLKLPADSGPEGWWLTEFEDPWPYRVAPADVYFSRDADQGELKRPPVTRFVAGPAPPDAAGIALALAVLLQVMMRMGRRESP